MFPLNFHYEDVSRQDPLLKPNHANVMEVPGSCEIILVPVRFHSDLRIRFVKLAMEMTRGQRFFQKKRGPSFQAGKSYRDSRYSIGSIRSIYKIDRSYSSYYMIDRISRIGSEKHTGYVSYFARKSALRGHGMSNFLVRISTVMSIFYYPVEIRENPILLSMETEFCEFSPELEYHFEIFEHLRGFNVTIVTSANTKDETLPPWSGFLLKDEGETK